MLLWLHSLRLWPLAVSWATLALKVVRCKTLLRLRVNGPNKR